MLKEKIFEDELNKLRTEHIKYSAIFKTGDKGEHWSKKQQLARTILDLQRLDDLKIATSVKES